MLLEPALMEAVEQLGYRVTVGDVVAQSGLEINRVQPGLIHLAAVTKGHLQVRESGEIVYLFPENFRAVLQRKFFSVQLQKWRNRLWKGLFYLIRISFGIVLLLSMLLVIVAIIALLLAANTSRNEKQRSNKTVQPSSNPSDLIVIPHFWLGLDRFWLLEPDADRRPATRTRSRYLPDRPMNFFEAIFSFLFGDGNPNENLEDRRWRAIARVIHHHQGAVVAEQIAPYLDHFGAGNPQRGEAAYMLPVLIRFNGRPEVSETGDIIYHFPDLQSVTRQPGSKPGHGFLEELPWRFSQAGTGKIMLATSLGVIYFTLSLGLGYLLTNQAIATPQPFISWVQSIYWFLLTYSIAFLTIPLLRYGAIQWLNLKIRARNRQRQARSQQLAEANSDLRRKLSHARKFAGKRVISQPDLAYTTETDLLEQAIAQGDIEED